jgi:hypothetical protein
MILHSLLQRQIIELSSQRELAIHLFLRDPKVYYVEEAYMVHGMLQLSCELLFSAWFVELCEVECHELGPAEILFRLGHLLIGTECRRRHFDIYEE